MFCSKHRYRTSRKRTPVKRMMIPRQGSGRGLAPLIVALLFTMATMVVQAGFLPNRGQVVYADGRVATDVLFHGRLTGMDVAIRADGWSYVLYEAPRGTSTTADDPVLAMTPQADAGRACRVDLRLRGSRRPQAVITDDVEPGLYHTYATHCPDGVTGVPSYRRVTLAGVYPNIDIVLTIGAAGTLKYDIVVHPGGDVADVVFDVAGATAAADGGGYRLDTPFGAITEGAPVCWQTRDGDTAAVAGRCAVDGAAIRFDIAPYDRAATLVVDPPIAWCTFFGGAGVDWIFDVAVGSDGQPVITGQVSSSDLPVTPGVAQTTPGSIIVVKHAADGRLVWCTYYTGGGGYGIDVDQANNVYVTGWTGQAMPVTPNAHQATFRGVFDAFLLGLTSDGQRRFATMLGGPSNDVAADVSVDLASTAVYVTGRSTGRGLPVTANAHQPEYAGADEGALNGEQAGDAFLLRATLDGVVTLVTYYGGSGRDEAYGIKAANDRIYICGRTSSYDLPASDGGFFPHAPTSADEMFVATLAPTTGAPTWSTYVGGRRSDVANDIDLSGFYDVNAQRSGYQVVVVGRTTSDDLPVRRAWQGTYAGGYNPDYGGDGVVMVMVDYLDGGQELQRLTYLGTEADDAIMSVTNGHVLVNSTGDFGLGSEPGGGTDAWVLRLPVWNAPDVAWAFGGAGDDFDKLERNMTFNTFALGGVAASPDGSVYVAGYTQSSTLPRSLETGRQPRSAGKINGFLARLGCGQRPVFHRLLRPDCPGAPGRLVLDDPDGSIASIEWENGITADTLDVYGRGPYRVRVRRTDGCLDSTSILLDLPATPPVTVTWTSFGDDCSAFRAELVADYPDAPSGAVYEWSNGAVGQSTIVDTPGIYTVTLVLGPDCRLVSAPVTVVGSGGGAVPSGIPVLGDATLVAGTGDVIALPLRIEGAADVAALPVSWEARLRLDASVFYPLPPAVAGAIVNGTRDVVLRGDRPATSAELVTLECVVALGERSTAAIDIVSFVWTVCGDTVAGRGTVVDVENVCAAGGRERLFRDGASAAVAVRPNPAVGGGSVVVVDAQERGLHRLVVVDGTGRRVADLGGYDLSRGSQATVVLPSTLAAGQYQVVVTGPTTLVATILTVLP